MNFLKSCNVTKLCVCKFLFCLLDFCGNLNTKLFEYHWARDSHVFEIHKSFKAISSCWPIPNSMNVTFHFVHSIKTLSSYLLFTVLEWQNAAWRCWAFFNPVLTILFSHFEILTFYFSLNFNIFYVLNNYGGCCG